MKITAIHGGGDWADASAQYLVLPEGMSFQKEFEAWEKWTQNRGKEPYVGIFEWLKARGAVEPTKDQLEIFWDY